jgi:hypothetical protein
VKEGEIITKILRTLSPHFK